MGLDTDPYMWYYNRVVCQPFERLAAAESVYNVVHPTQMITMENVMKLNRKIYTEAHRRASRIRGQIDNLRIKLANARLGGDVATEREVQRRFNMLMIELRGVTAMVEAFEAINPEVYREEPAKLGMPVRKVVAV